MNIGDRVIFITYADEAIVTGVLDHSLYAVRYDGDEYIATEEELALLTTEEPPPSYILVPVGEYDGIDLPDTEVDENIVWQKLPNPEADCTVL